MKADKRFTNLDLDFWANVRLISQECGYTDRKTKLIKVPSLREIIAKYRELGFNTDRIIEPNGDITTFGSLLLDYFSLRADFLSTHAEKNLMNAEEAKALFEGLVVKYKPKGIAPKNKQSGEKAVTSYFTGIINTLVEAHSGTCTVNYAPRELTVITKDASPVRTLSRQVDGAFPTVIDPVAIWEIKEYYYTTTFGSRIADGVYETQLDGLEFKEARESLGFNIKHYLMVDAYYTWWGMGKSYLCRMCDMLHMGITSEILFGREVVHRLPDLVSEWVEDLNSRGLKS